MSETVEIIHDDRSVMLLPSRDLRRIKFEAEVAEQLKRNAEAAKAAQAEPQVEPRAALREAVQMHQARARHLGDLLMAAPKADATVSTARAAVEKATATLEDAKREASSHQLAAAMGTAKGKAPSIAEARRALERAQDELEAANAASVDLQAQRADAESAVAGAHYRLDRAVTAVVQADPATAALFEEFERVRQQCTELRQAVELVAGHFPYARRLALLAERTDHAPSAKRAEWERALAMLREDANVVLP